MRMARGFGKREWREAAEKALSVVLDDPWWIGKELDGRDDLRWRLEWTPVAYTDTLRIEHRTATWADSTFGAKSVWRVVER